MSQVFFGEALISKQNRVDASQPIGSKQRAPRHHYLELSAGHLGPRIKRPARIANVTSIVGRLGSATSFKARGSPRIFVSTVLRLFDPKCYRGNIRHQNPQKEVEGRGGRNLAGNNVKGCSMATKCGTSAFCPANATARADSEVIWARLIGPAGGGLCAGSWPFSSYASSTHP